MSISLLVYSAVGIAVILAGAVLFTYYDNVRYNKKLRELPKRSERRQSYVEAHQQHKIASGVVPGYSEKLPAMLQETTYATTASKAGLWRSTQPAKRTSPQYLPQQRTFYYPAYRNA